MQTRTKKLLTVITVATAGILAVLAVVIQMQPEDFRVTRSALISAAPETTFVYVNDMRNWNDWSPWAKLDPQAKYTLEGPYSGVGAVFHWDGNSEVGAGSMTITESRPGELVRYRLDFIKPFEGTNMAELTFRPEGTGTLVTWTMEGKKNFFMKAMSLVMDCEKMIGPYFEEGLANLNARIGRATG